MSKDKQKIYTPSEAQSLIQDDEPFEGIVEFTAHDLLDMLHHYQWEEAKFWGEWDVAGDQKGTTLKIKMEIDKERYKSNGYADRDKDE